MKMLPEVRAAADELSALLDDEQDLAGRVVAIAAVARAVVPSCVGVSLTIVVDGEPYTLTATSEELATIDATQYIDGGPCVEAAERSSEVSIADVLDEEQWQLFQHACAASGVRSSLSLPLRDDENALPCALNLYASEPGAFMAQQSMLADIFDVRVSEFVANADLPFRTRDWAGELPERVAAKRTVELAVGVLVQLRGWQPGEARSRLITAAAQAGAPVGSVAQMLLTLTAG
jgi:GAF domain/ANTAR domain